MPHQQHTWLNQKLLPEEKIAWLFIKEENIKLGQTLMLKVFPVCLSGD